MGCGDIRKTELKSWELISHPLSNHMHYLSNNTPEEKEINKLIQRSELILYQIEKVRQNIVDELDEIIFATGEYVFSSPTIVNCLHCVLYLIALELNGDITKLNKHYSEEVPFLIISTDKLSQKATDLFQMIQKYIHNLIYLKTTIRQLENDIPELLFMINEINCDEYKEKIKENNILISIALKALPLLKTVNLSYIQSYQKECYYFDTMQEIYEKKIQLFCREVNQNELSNDIADLMFSYKAIQIKHPKMFSSIKMESSVKIARKKIKKIIDDKQELIQQFVKVVSV